jgi:hypothetical protein
MRISLTRSATLMMFLVLLWGGLPAYGQVARLQLNNLEKLSKKAAEVVDVTLDGPMLKLASKFLNEDEDSEAAEVKELVKGLKGIYVKSFEFDKEGEYSEEDVDAIRAQLKGPGWTRIVGVVSKREHENTEVYMMVPGSGESIEGLAIINAEPKELTVVNIIGPIDLDKLSALEGHMGVPKLELEKGKAPQKPASGKPAGKEQE